jgi:hypothetical protein
MFCESWVIGPPIPVTRPMRSTSTFVYGLALEPTDDFTQAVYLSC